MHSSPTGTGAPRATWEMIAVVATAIAHVVCEAAGGARGVFIVLASASWLGYVVCRVRAEPGILAKWGVRSACFWPAFAVTTAVAAPAAIGMASVGSRQNTLVFNAHFLLALALYPLWGMVQQFLVQAMATRNLLRWLRSTWAVCPTVAALFALVHVPNLPLMGATFALGVVFTAMYCRWRSVWPLGLYHGWLGALFYFWVLGRDPWLEVLGR